MEKLKREREEVLNRWIAVFESKWGRVESDAEVLADLRALSDIHPDDLDTACLRAYEECQYYPRIRDIRSRVEHTNAEQTQLPRHLFLRSVSDICYAAVDGTFSSEFDRKTGKRIRCVIHCGCSNCDPIGRREWEEANCRRRGKPIRTEPGEHLIECAPTDPDGV